MTRRQIAVMAACAIWLLLVAMDISGCQGQALQSRGAASPQPTPTLQGLAVTPVVPIDNRQVAQLVSDQLPATFDHTPLRPLGTHREVRCMSCHGQGRSVNCESCHQTSATHLPGIRGKCFTCHSLESWQPAKYDHKPTVDLGKQHDGLACGSCHEGGILAASTVKCQTCHSIPNGHAPGITDGCVQCHSPGGWKPAKVTHTRFALAGQHQDVPCANCHADGAYAGRPAACESCHAKPTGHIPGVSGSCVQCHSPNGWRPAAFSHTKFALAGGHQGVTCASCHADGAYAGRPAACESCHAKPSGHIPGVSSGCVQCHSPAGWKPANFSHTKFALTGGHTGVACASCHSNGVYAGHASTCESCHAKPSGHIPGVSGSCVQCHSLGGWKPATFSHIKFALTGAHQSVACASCHANGVYTGHASTCESCHKTPTGHIPGITSGCVQCHSPGGWKPATFSHTKFALTGGHTGVACGSCHANGVYAGHASTCESCHKTPAGHIPGITSGCVQCHSPVGWKPATFSHTKFALTGGHTGVACGSCHANGVYAGHASTCESCHAKPSGHIPGVSGSCVQCHSPGGWKPATFSHTKFALTGGHTGVACASCHANGVYAGHASTCESCHKTPAGHIPGITSGCVQCHSPGGWKPATFSHTKFALTGRHTGVACATCHKNGVYAGTSALCQSCHTPPGTHAGLSTACVSCHNSTGFKPSTFAHRSVGEHIGSSPERPLACTTCHPSKFTDRNCLGSGCHKSTPRY